jgi:hypothetical protein
MDSEVHDPIYRLEDPMNTLRSPRRKLLAAAAAVAILSGCQSGPKPPQPGTPAFNWLAAKDAYKNGDFVKANDLLTQLSNSDNEFAERARPWALVTSLGLANSYMTLADKFDQGAKRNRSNPTPFRRTASEYKVKANAAALQFAEVSHRFVAANKDKDVVFAFDPPAGAFDEPVQFQKITAGQMIPAAELAGVENVVIKAEMLRGVCRALNTPKDPDKARAAFQAGEAKVPGPSMLLAVANGLYGVSEMFGPKKLDQPHRIKMLYDEASQALSLLPDNKDAKELSKKISDSRKKNKLG